MPSGFFPLKSELQLESLQMKIPQSRCLKLVGSVTITGASSYCYAMNLSPTLESIVIEQHSATITRHSKKPKTNSPAFGVVQIFTIHAGLVLVYLYIFNTGLLLMLDNICPCNRLVFHQQPLQQLLRDRRQPSPLQKWLRNLISGLVVQNSFYCILGNNIKVMHDYKRELQPI